MKRCHYTSQQEATEKIGIILWNTSKKSQREIEISALVIKEIKDEIDKSTIATVYKNQRLAYGKK